MTFTRKVLLSTLGLSLGFAATQASAESNVVSPVTSNFDVKIEIVASCEIGTGTPQELNFGTHDMFKENVLGSTELSVRCTKGSEYKIALNAGANAEGGDYTKRRMKGVSDLNSNDYVSYNLYTDEGRSRVWGNVETSMVSKTGTGEEEKITIYGKVPSTNFTVGNYKDTITATVTF